MLIHQSKTHCCLLYDGLGMVGSIAMGLLGIFLSTLRPIDAIWRDRSGSTLAQVMACCLTAPSHYLNQCWLKPGLHSRGFRAGCTRLDDPCTTGSTTLPRPGTSVSGRERAWATAWRFSTGSEFLSWGKNQSRFFLSGAQTCLFVSWRPWL